MNFKFFLFTAILVGTLVFGSAFAEESKVAPALPTAVAADPFYWGEGGFGLDVLRGFEMPLDPYLTPGVTADSPNSEILSAYYEANPDLAAELVVPENQRAKNYIVHFSDGDFTQGITVTSFSNFIAPDAFSDSVKFHLQGLPSKDKEVFYEHIHDWFTQGLTVAKFNVVVDVVSVDDTILQTWEFKKCSITNYAMLQQDSKLVVSFRQLFIPEIREQTSFSCDGFSLHTEQQTNKVNLENSLPTKQDSAQTFIVRFHDGAIPEPMTFTTFSKFSHISSQAIELPIGKISIPVEGKVFEGKPQFVLESLPSKDKEWLYQFADDWLSKETITDPIDVDIEFVTGDGTIIQTWEYTDCDLLDLQIYSADSLLAYQFTGKVVIELRDMSHFSCNGFDFSTEHSQSNLTSVPINPSNLIPDEASRGQVYLVKISGGMVPEPTTFTTFSKFTHESPTIENTEQPFLSKDKPKFVLESLPSKDKAEFYQGINNWFTQVSPIEPADVQIDILTGDGTILRSYEYIQCDVIGYEPYLNDDFIAFKFTGQFKMELRDKTSFECDGYHINSDQKKSEFVGEPTITFVNTIPENSQRAQAYIVTLSSGYFESPKSFTTFSKFSPGNIFEDLRGATFTLESLTNKDNILLYEEINRWRTQQNPPTFDTKVDMISGDGTILQSLEYSKCKITDFNSFIIDDLIRMKHTYGVLPEIRDRTHFECTGIFFNTEQQKSSISNTFEVVTPEALVPLVVDRAQAFFVTASGGKMAQAISSTDFAKFIHVDAGESIITQTGSTFYGSKDVILSGLPTKNQVGGVAEIERRMTESESNLPFDVHVGVISGDGTLLQISEYVDCDVENYVTNLYHNILFLPYSFESGSEIRHHILLNCVGFDIDFENKPTAFSPETIIHETSEITPLLQMKLGGLPNNIQCKDGQTSMLRPSQDSGGCFNDSNVSKMLDRNWIKAIPHEAQTLETISNLDFVPTFTDRAKSFNVKFFDGNFKDGIEYTTFSNFYPFTEQHIIGIEIPNYEFGSKPEFVLESLPSKDKQVFYDEVKKWKDETGILSEFDVIVDVVTDDETILETWNYLSCKIVGYELVLDENLVLVKYHDQWQPEIAEKSKFSCNGLDFKAGIW